MVAGMFLRDAVLPAPSFAHLCWVYDDRAIDRPIAADQDEVKLTWHERLLVLLPGGRCICSGADWLGNDEVVSIRCETLA